MTSDAARVRVRQLLVLSGVNAFDGLRPVLLMIIGDRAGP